MDEAKAIKDILETPVKEVEPGTRVYTSSESHGTDRYHLIERLYSGIQLEQIDVDDKWSKRVKFGPEEIPALIKTLITWHLEDLKQKEKLDAAAAGEFLDLDDNNPF